MQMLNAKINSIPTSWLQLVLISLILMIGFLFLASPEVKAIHCNGKNNLSPAAIDNCEKEDKGTNTGGTNSGGDTADKTSFSFGTCGKKDVGIDCLVVELLRFLSIAVGIAVVAGITFGGITYSTSRGNPGQAQKGVTIITNSILGLVLYFLMFAIVNFLIPGGILK